MGNNLAADLLAAITTEGRDIIEKIIDPQQRADLIGYLDQLAFAMVEVAANAVAGLDVSADVAQAKAIAANVGAIAEQRLLKIAHEATVRLYTAIAQKLLSSALAVLGGGL